MSTRRLSFISLRRLLRTALVTAFCAALLLPANTGSGAGDTFIVPLCLQVAYQGHGAAGGSRWTLPIDTAVYDASSNDLLANWTQTSDADGGFCSVISGSESPAQVDIRVKHGHTLSNKKYDLPLPGAGEYINMGTLLEGDADGNDAVSITDFSILRTTYGATCPACDARADFNEDGAIAITDFSLLRTNYARSGPVTIAALPRASTGVTLTLAPLLTTISPGAVTATLDIVLLAGDQAVDGVDIYLDFDPLYLMVSDAAGAPLDALAPGDSLPMLLQNSVDNALGHINYSAGILSGDPVTGTISVARFYVTPLRRDSLVATPITFSLQSPRRTDVAFAGESVLAGTVGGRVSLPASALLFPVISSNLPLPYTPAGRYQR